ncbi:TetR/AcrR family transcriptional regulator [Umezawaea endophytica]|uniref:TetR/AcrR family transcriptional regulator n=1 Tax=Umezawaea endophytica TaxID=1654476 RepID=A0A9X2VKX2_9PSEU|nr:TetR/AcrR family transcriptional regulator [Umezawaea endophytica]MCS7478475.1 TetR/AcrR family transcriptional regulator [Umezawaea endophytica]
MTRRAPTGAALLQPAVTKAITESVLAEWAENGYARLSMEAVAKRAGVGKSALYRRWPSKQEMAMSVIADFSVTRAATPDTGSLRGDLREALDSLHAWLTDEHFARILPDLVAETARNPELGEFVKDMIGTPRREHSAAMLHRAAERGELAPDADLELVQDLIASPLYWRLSVRGAAAEPDYLDKLTDLILRSISTIHSGPRGSEPPTATGSA